MCTFGGSCSDRWNGMSNFGIANANQIPWSNIKAMMTTEYCPSTEIQKMEQELWTLTLKGDDIEAYNNRFHELVLMCPELVSTKKKKIEKSSKVYVDKAPAKGSGLRWELTMVHWCKAIFSQAVVLLGVIAGVLKNRNNNGNQVKGTEARGMVLPLVGGETNQNLNNMEDDINA
ncbi:putative reverse transcriptase domain-containing protein [Tanacetum coccineum]